jgi:hypothetical protein
MDYELGETLPYRPLREIHRDDEFRKKLRDAEIILAIDRLTGAPYGVFYGEDTLKEIGNRVRKSDRQRTVIVPIDTTPEDEDSDDMDNFSEAALLSVMVEELKGSCDFASTAVAKEEERVSRATVAPDIDQQAN